MLDTPTRTPTHIDSRDKPPSAARKLAENDSRPTNRPRMRVTPLERFLDEARFDASDPHSLADTFRGMVDHALDRLPLPGRGETLLRWRALAEVAARDLGLVKLYEGHTDALAVLAELNAPAAPAGSRWGVWAAEPPDARVIATTTRDGRLLLNGTKAWCSGADAVTHAVITAWLDGEHILAAVDMRQPTSISTSTEHWRAVGMRATASGDVRFDGATAIQVGQPHDYVKRLGFWQGGAGIAACWYGAAAGIAQGLRERVARRPDPYGLAHLGAIDVALSGAAFILRETAARIDARPDADIKREALRARLAVEEAATIVMTRAGRALGAGPLCRDERFARAMADLPVFLRQSHAERDLAALGESVTEEPGGVWTL
jgi:alkylation response protein AidB-like acyl-CoA dehydrogenase